MRCLPQSRSGGAEECRRTVRRVAVPPAAVVAVLAVLAVAEEAEEAEGAAEAEVEAEAAEAAQEAAEAEDERLRAPSRSLTEPRQFGRL